MRKIVFYFCVLSLALVGTQARAQSSVTLSGALDAGVSYISNQGGDKNIKFDDGIAMPNLLLLTGREDLGGGNAAIFRLNNQFVLGSGAFMPQGSLFTHEAFVGLESQTFGKLTLGNQFDFMIDTLFFNQYDAGGMFAVGQYDFRNGPFTKLDLPDNPTGSYDWDRMETSSAIANSVKWSSPDFYGFSGGVMYGFGGVAGSIGSDNATSFGLNYAHGDFGFGAAYTNVKSGVDGAQASVRNWGLGSHYRAGPFMTMVLFTTVHNSMNGGGIWEVEVGEAYQVTPFLSLSGAYMYMKGNDAVDSNHAHQLSASISYFLSKRTSVYVDGVYQRANNGANALINGLIGPAAAASGASQAIARIGMVTHF
ncbi:porin [Paraburkholderia acidicola]|uniref:Porin n=1 Tax=Paraburkholderia acidicola TaxID=1912599 RepID=A0ABV1LVJ7_9BURK